MADPNTAEAKPKLVAVEGAEPAATPEKAAAEPKPKAAATPPPPAPAPREETPKRGVSKVLFWLVVVLLGLSVFGLWTTSGTVSTQAARIEGLSSQVVGLQSEVVGLQSELAAANTQVQTYSMQMTLVQQEVGKLLESMAILHELVLTDPLSPGPLRDTLPEAPTALGEAGPTL